MPLKKPIVQKNKPIVKEKETVRINKHMANLGLASRREADEMIAIGSVFVNGVKAVPGMQIDPLKDKIEVRADKKFFVYYAYNKPIGIITTGAQGNEKDIVSYTKFPQPVFPLGRLDKDSHGLILLTNDRRITHRLLDPKFDHEKEYRVTVEKQVNRRFINRLDEGIRIGGVKTKPAKITRESDQSFRITLTEGKNRQIRRMVDASGNVVTDLIRLRIENILLGNLKAGSFRPLTVDETAVLLKKLALK